jgi:hypothetical protein
VSENGSAGRRYSLDAEGEPLFLYDQVARAVDARQLPRGVPRTQLERGVIVQIVDEDGMRVRWPATKYSEVMRSQQVLKVDPPTYKPAGP